MARSYRGKDVDMISLAKKYEKTVALGNAHMNGRGDILGKGGKIVKTREEQLAEYYEGNQKQIKSVNLKEDSINDVEKEVKSLQEEIREELKAKPKSKKTPIYEDITDNEIKELNKELKKGE